MLAFARLVEPRYTLPSRRYFSDVALPELHSIVETHIHELLAMGVTAISLTTDIWASDVSLMSITSVTAVGRRGFRTAESRIACSRMCWFTYR
jgi:hypothetical protein